MEGLWAVIMAINIAAFTLMGVDKNKAKKHQYRIRERTLWLAAIFGGAVGATIGMYFFRHKTRHLQFKIGFPILAIIDVILIIKGVF